MPRASVSIASRVSHSFVNLDAASRSPDLTLSITHEFDMRAGSLNGRELTTARRQCPGNEETWFTRIGVRLDRGGLRQSPPGNEGMYSAAHGIL